MRRRSFVFLAVVSAVLAADDEYVFKSDVSLVRVDTQVVDRQNRAVTGLSVEDFIVRENGAVQDIKNFAREDMPVDVLLLLDVSGSMRPHIERVADASDRAASVLGKDDRLGIMVFDRQTRIRMPLRASQGDIRYAFDELLREETFNGGTDITRALYDAAEYMRRDGRKNARRAIVILTDDQTERGRDERGVGQALARGDIVLSALIAPEALGSGRIRIGGGGGGWPGTGGPLGGIILGPRSRFPGRGGGPVITRGGHTGSAGTENIARQSGGDSFRVEEASAFETTLERLRQRYALYFQLPDGVKPGQERDIQVELTASAKRRYPAASVNFRRIGDNSDPGRNAPVVISSAPDPNSAPPRSETRPATQPSATASSTGGWRRADEAERTSRPTLSSGEGGSRGPDVRSVPTASAPASSAPTVSAPGASVEQPKRGGWRRVKPGEEP